MAESHICFYLVLQPDKTVAFCNQYFLHQFEAASSPDSLLNKLTPESATCFNNLFPLKPNCTATKNLVLEFAFSNGNILNTRWDFGVLVQDGKSYLEGIGAPILMSGENTDKNKNTEESNWVKELARTSTSSSGEDQYKFLFFKNPLPMWIYDVATLRFLEVNEAAVSHYGYSREEFLSMTIMQIRAPQQMVKLHELQHSPVVLDAIYKGTWEHRKKNGELIEVQITAHRMELNGQPAKLVLVNDITESLKAERKLLQSNERYTYASKATFDAIWDWDFATNHLYWNDGFSLLFGYEVQNNQGHIESWHNYIHTDDRERVIKGVQQAIDTGASNWTDEYKYIKADGSFAYVIDRGIIIRDKTGKAVRMIGAMQDITIRKVNEQQLQKINLQLLRQQKERELTASILRSLSEKEMLNDALEDILRKLTLFFNFDIGEAWFVNMDNVRLELRQKWSVSKDMEIFYEVHPDVKYKLRTKGFLGDSWNENEIIFIDDLANYKTFERKKGALKAGLTKSLGVPILFKGQPIALFSFFGRKEIADKEKVRSYFEALGIQLGLDIQRKKTEEELNKFFDLSPEILTIIGFDGFFKKINHAFSNILGYEAPIPQQLHFAEFVHPNDVDTTLRFFNDLKASKARTFENRFRTKSGDYRWLSWAAAPLIDEGLIYATAKDITDKKELDSRLTRILESISDGFFTVDRDFTILYWNKQAEKLSNVKRSKVLGKRLFDIFKKDVPSIFFNSYIKALDNNEVVHVEEFIPLANKWFEVNAYPYEGILSVFFKDITERKQSEDIIRISSERYEVLAKATKDAIWDWNLQNNTVTWNEGLRTIFNYENVSVVNDSDWWQDRLHPDDRDRVIAGIEYHTATHQTNWEDEYRFRCADGTYKYIYDRGFTIYDSDKRPLRMIGSMQDLTDTKKNELMLKELNESLEKRANQLATSNAELESFAYVASHDLQEPLRMVSSFLQLIEKKYKDKLDQKAHEYIRFAVDGAERMKGLILDLLEYSRVNSRKTEKEPVDLNELADNLRLTYEKPVKEAKGKLIIGKLPVVMGNKLQLMQLFQNLAGNALKYRSDKPPIIEISVADTDNVYQFAVSDNGIGIEPRFYNKIFVIFQRLHNKNEYSGTGIGLAICKKIVELHAGNIWVESQPGKGSTFFFTIPKTMDVEQPAVAE